jgi:hypothetical protein
MRSLFTQRSFQSLPTAATHAVILPFLMAAGTLPVIGRTHDRLADASGERRTLKEHNVWSQNPSADSRTLVASLRSKNLIEAVEGKRRIYSISSRGLQAVTAFTTI